MSSFRPGPTALALGVATWAQLCLAPAVSRSPVDLLSLLFAALPLAALVGAAALARRDVTRASALGLAGFPILVGLSAFVSGRDVVPRFDAPSRVLAAATALAALAAAAAWRRSLWAAVPVTTTLDDRAPAPSSRLQAVSFGALALVASAVAVLAPAHLGAREPDTVAERLAGEALLRGRGAMVSAAGTLLALAVVLRGGSDLLRAGPPRPRAPSRAVAYALWGLCAYIMRRWLDHAR